MRLTIDNREVEAAEGATLLDVAETNGLYIPHLCYHPALKPYGGCRLCVVEIDDIRGCPTACTTPAQTGMVVRTRTRALLEMRREVLQLILSEHPAACLVCEEARECAGWQQTIRKAGATTGCRWCPKDRDCELQKVVEALGVDEITFPVYYRGIPLEKDDPFFDRDYNLCIYCARCTRVCQEYRLSSVIALNQRGRQTLIGPAFGQSHIEAGCEFCGACVSVCPTGAMAEKMKKWSGTPEKLLPTVCPLCSLHCDLLALERNGRLIGTLPPGDPHTTGGDLCAKGRFCLAELINHADRAIEPRRRFPEGVGAVSWDDALAVAAARLKETSGDKTAVYLSPHLSREAMAAAEWFFHETLGAVNLAASALGHVQARFFALAEHNVPPAEIRRADVVVSFFLDGNYAYAPTALAIKHAAAAKTQYFQVGWWNDPTSRFAAQQIFPSVIHYLKEIESLVESVRTRQPAPSGYAALAEALRQASAPVLVVGPAVADLTGGDLLLRAVEALAGFTGAGVHAPHTAGDVAGLVSLTEVKPEEAVRRRIMAGEIDLLYLVGDTPFTERPPVDFVVLQSAFPGQAAAFADLVLPAAVWGEEEGTGPGGARFARVAPAPGKALSQGDIFTRLFTAVKGEPAWFSPAMARRAPERPVVEAFNRLTRSEACPGLVSGAPPLDEPQQGNPSGLEAGELEVALLQFRNPHRYLDAALNALVEGLGELAPLGALILNPDDASALASDLIDRVWVTSADGVSRDFPVVLRHTAPPGYAHLMVDEPGFAFSPNPCPVRLRRSHV